jgi:photosystem II stability/assembly factor-like uncharacterized protein
MFVNRRIPAFLLSALLLPLPALAERPRPADPSTEGERTTAWQKHLELDQSSLFKGLSWRNVGPVVQGGRVVDIESVPGEPYTFYVAYASGGLWRTTNNGVTFEPLFDDQPTLIMGDIAVDPQNPQTIWVGTGEHNSSRSSYGGLGLFRSDDAGATWRPAGLAESDRIGRIVIDPRDSNRVYVAVLGKLYTKGGQRGLYRTTNGGERWEKVLDAGGAENAYTGFIDLVIDPTNPDVLYATSWERSRRPWNFVEGGPGSGIWKSTDGGTTWKRLEGGFPQGEHVGRIGLALAPSQPQTLYACLDNQEPLPEEQWDLGTSPVNAKRLRKMTKEEFLTQDPEEIESFIRNNDLDSSLDAAGLIEMVKNDQLSLEDILAELDDANANLFNTDIRGLEIWRSDDGGTSWRRTHQEPLRQVVYTYGYYFGQIRVDPQDVDRIYVVGVPMVTSGDGGKTFEGMTGSEVHADHHAVWIDPRFPQRVLLGNDGGLDISYDGGKSWVKLDAEPVGQFYTVAVDMAEPYNIYGGLQDNGVLKGSSLSRAGIETWERIGGGDGMYVQIDPRDNLTTYLGFQFGFYGRIHAEGHAEVRPRDKLGEPALRYNWTTPILLSSHNHDILYFGANKLYRSLDQGTTWTAISPDLTSSEHRGDVPFATLTTIAESPLTFGLLWTGTDDGHVHVSKDGGVEWQEVSQAFPTDRWVTRVEPSHHVEERAYVSLSGYRDDDITAYLYATEDLGATWTSLAAGLPAETINVVKEDPVNQDVLWLGTDRGAYVSLDRGHTWQGLPAGLPNVPVHDLVVHPRERELVVGTHGRSIFVLDALPAQELTPAVRKEPVHLFPVEDVVYQRSWQSQPSLWFHDPDLELRKVDIPFWTAEAGTAKLQVLDSEGHEIRSLSLETERGVNTFTWDLLFDEQLGLAAEKARNEAGEGEEKTKKGKKKHTKEDDEQTPERGMLAKTPWAEAVRLDRPLHVTPGSYTLRVTVGEGKAETPLEMNPPEPWEPREKKKAKMRGEKDDE